MADYSFNIIAGKDAFGDGSHPSTQGALTALEAMAGFHGMASILDLGCGCGILALCEAYQWHVPVIAADIKQEAVDATRENACANQLDALITTVRSDGFSHPEIGRHAPYGLITANILGEILIKLAHDMSQHLVEEGIVILSGMLAWQAESVQENYEACGLTLVQRLTVSDWVTLIMQKQG